MHEGSSEIDINSLHSFHEGAITAFNPRANSKLKFFILFIAKDSQSFHQRK